MTATSSSPEIQNVIPMKYFGTDTFAAPIIGIAASVMMLTLGMLWLTKRAKSAKVNGEGYGNHSDKSIETDYSNLPNIFSAILPIIIIFVTNLFFSKVYYENIDGSYLSEFGTTLSSVSGTWSVIIAIVLADVFIVLTNLKKNTKFKIST